MSEDFDASVRAAADDLNAACDAMWNDHDRIEERSALGGPRLKEKRVEAIAVAQQRLFFALLRPDALAAAEARIKELEAAVIRTAASLAAAISLLERGGNAAKKAAPSDAMFDQMLKDYRGALQIARQAMN